jgi:tetratricopeptide (TPR) repeat protein/HEAT repeat protein
MSKYRSDVHQLHPPAPPDALSALEAHLGQSLPSGIRQFLGMHNGAVLFRGALRVRATADVTVASDLAPGVVLFADGPGEARWAWAVDRRGQAVFGSWDGQRLVAEHATFGGWLSASISVIEARVTRPEDREALRLEADPEDVWQLVGAGARALAAGRPERAVSFLQRVTERDPEHVRAWQLLGDALVVLDRRAARAAWLQAFKRARLPAGWPGAPLPDPESLRGLALALADAEAWEAELARFLDEQVEDVCTSDGAQLVEAVGLALARSRVERGRRREARDGLSSLLGRFHAFTWGEMPWPAVLELARFEAALGHHDEAEALLRRIRREGDHTLRGEAGLVTASIAITRQEPWAEDLLDEAASAGLTDTQRVEWAVLVAERAVRQERVDVAAEAVAHAEAGARRTGLRVLAARVALVQGDVARLRGDSEQAAAIWRGALELASGRSQEVASRIALRLGDLALQSGDLPGAEQLYHKGLKGFSQAMLPVREAWALVRLGRLALAAGQEVSRSLLVAARERFAEADLAAGMAAVDALAGDPGLSLAWHLERSAAQARARHDAQRSRPPWERADADRPERRLGAHRIAVAASGRAVVRALQRELDATARAALAGRGRPSDPPVLRYVAAVDLLSGHRSFEASEVLLRHLLERAVEGPAYRALQGAIARSPNAALVDGLLRCVESPRSTPAHAVAAAAELLGIRREAASVRPLVALARGGRPVVRRAAVCALGRIGDRSTVGAVASALEDARLAEPAALALLLLGDPQGVHFHREALVQRRTDLSGHPGEIVGRYGGPENYLLLRSAAAGTGEMALGAIQGLGLLGDPRGVADLLARLRTPDTQVVEVAAGALEILTGHHEDLARPGSRHRWEAWWAANGEQFPQGVRYRGGRRLDAGWLIDRMAHDDAYTRRTAYDELVITTGEDRPFDADGPWRIQQAHLRAWRVWWQQTGHAFPAGHWYLDGKAVH